MTFLWGALIVVVGILVVVFSENIYNFTGAIDFVERHAPGNSRNFIKLLGIIVIIIGIIVFSGAGGLIFGGILEWFAGLFSLNK
jgi:uncharacterized membrane protein YidH (DUF202 family)